MKKDFYEILGVERNASAAEIKKAYRKKAMQYHPDRHSGDKKAESEAKFKEITEAYTILADQKKRSSYDNFGDASAAGQDPFGQGFGQGSGFPDLNDIFNSMFGGGQESGASQQHGSDLAYNVRISLNDAAFGVEKEISIRKKCPCEMCSGSGAAKGSKSERCSTCHGQGRVTMQQGFLAMQQTCPSCNGDGTKISQPCTKCHGQGCYNQPSTIKVRIPAGVDNGDRMRVTGKGDAGLRGSPAGDLYISIEVSQHELFERDGVDLHCKIPISFYQACLGGETEIATLDKRVKLTIPPETRSGNQLRLRGKGIKSVKNNRQGDIICHIAIETPVKLNKAQKSLLKEFDESISNNASQNPETQSFIKKIKSLLG